MDIFFLVLGVIIFFFFFYSISEFALFLEQKSKALSVVAAVYSAKKINKLQKFEKEPRRRNRYGDY